MRMILDFSNNSDAIRLFAFYRNLGKAEVHILFAGFSKPASEMKMAVAIRVAMNSLPQRASWLSQWLIGVKDQFPTSLQWKI
jgi:hypothetical protein